MPHRRDRLGCRTLASLLLIGKGMWKPLLPLFFLPLLALAAPEPTEPPTEPSTSTLERIEEQRHEEGGSSWIPIGGYNTVYKVFLGGGYFYTKPDYKFGVHGVATFVDVYQVMLHWEHAPFVNWKYTMDGEYSRGFEPYYGEGSDNRASDAVKIWGDKTLFKPRFVFTGVDKLELALFADVRVRGEERVEGGARRNLFPNETTAGIGLSADYDATDNRDDPRDGYLLGVSYTHLPSSLTTVKTMQTISQVEGQFTVYQEMLAGVVAAMRFVGGFSFGTPSYLFKYRLGGADYLRGYLDNRFRGSKFYLQQTELRFPLPWIFSGAAFIGFGDAADRNFTAPKMAYGGGLRIGLPPDYVSKVRIDFGVGHDEQGIFVDFGHAF